MFSIFGLTSPWQNKNTMCIFIENMSMFSNPKAQINCTVFYIQTDNTHQSFKITTLFIPKSPGRNYAKQRQQSTLSTEMFILLFSMLASNYHETNRRLKNKFSTFPVWEWSLIVCCAPALSTRSCIYLQIPVMTPHVRLQFNEAKHVCQGVWNDSW